MTVGVSVEEGNFLSGSVVCFQAPHCAKAPAASGRVILYLLSPWSAAERLLATTVSLTPPLLFAFFSPPHLNLNHTPMALPCCALVLDNNLTPTEVDMIFVRSKSKGERRIKFREFVEAVHKMAAAKVRGV